MTTRRSLALLLIGGLILAACGGADPEGSPESLETIDLPDVDAVGTLTLERVLATRRSVRAFTDRELSLAEIGQLFWAAQGETRPGRRTSPSAGVLYPLEVYAVTTGGVHRYVPDGHRAEIVSRDDLRDQLFWAAYRQDAVGDAPVVFVICGIYARTETKYGSRAERYVRLEAGHAAQNLLLQAVALNLGAVPVGACFSGQVQRVLGLVDDYEPLYLIPVGHPESG